MLIGARQLGLAILMHEAAHGGLSVVYRRPDGNVGWIDPRNLG